MRWLGRLLWTALEEKRITLPERTYPYVFGMMIGRWPRKVKRPRS